VIDEQFRLCRRQPPIAQAPLVLIQLLWGGEDIHRLAGKLSGGAGRPDRQHSKAAESRTSAVA